MKIWYCKKCKVTSICNCYPPCPKVYCDKCGKLMKPAKINTKGHYIC